MTCVIEPNPAQVFSWLLIISTMFFTLHNRTHRHYDKNPGAGDHPPDAIEKRAIDHGKPVTDC